MKRGSGVPGRADLGRLADGMDERQVSGHRRGRGVGYAIIEVACEDCGAWWQDVWSLSDITEAKSKDGKEIPG